MRSFIFSLLIILVSFTFPPDANKQIISALKNSDAQNIVKFFSNDVDLEILDTKGFFSKEQSAVLLADFLKTHNFQDAIYISESSEEGFSTYIYRIKTADNQDYFLFYQWEQKASSQRIVSFKIIRSI